VTERGYKYYGLDPETYWDKIVEECEPSPVVRQPITQFFFLDHFTAQIDARTARGLVLIKLSVFIFLGANFFLGNYGTGNELPVTSIFAICVTFSVRCLIYIFIESPWA
jgi:hypothetical protein